MRSVAVAVAAVGPLLPGCCCCWRFDFIYYARLLLGSSEPWPAEAEAEAEGAKPAKELTRAAPIRVIAVVGQLTDCCWLHLGSFYKTLERCPF